MTPIQPGARIGILGGGQLGRLLALEAARLGFDVLIFCPEPDSPAARVSAGSLEAAYDDARALAVFAEQCDVVTYEFENVPVDAVRLIEAAGTPVRPGALSLEKSQDRLTEKSFLNEIGIPTVDYCALASGEPLDAALAGFASHAVLKTRRDGYDGKGQVMIGGGRGRDGLEDARNLAAGAPCLLEAFAPFEREISVVIARSETETLAYEPAENIHEGGILHRSRVPAEISGTVRAAAITAGRTLADALDHIGVLALEFFVLPGGQLLANEFAPRVHNSGHWTPDACDTGQFEQHIRAVAGWPLGPVTRRFDVEMDNLLGPDIARVPDRLGRSDRPVAYGKRAARAGRKMGHVTRRVRPL